jgi:hypothetical protein
VAYAVRAAQNSAHSVCQIGGAVYLTPRITSLVFERTQNSTRLLDEARRGFPTLLLNVAEDVLINSTVSAQGRSVRARLMAR